ncbi:MAG: hypothetical protein EXR75_16580, partial [Myxococcales bacterium]|nr:hypothetical protein [Myxococcales bacterium]
MKSTFVKSAIALLSRPIAALAIAALAIAALPVAALPAVLLLSGCTVDDACAGLACQCVSVTDCPGVTTQCAGPSCIGQKCGVDRADAGTPCSENGGTTCNGAGTCVGATLEWTPLSSTGAPSPRALHSAVWVGDKMLVWGGEGMGGALGDGAAYDPGTDSWTAIASTGAPSPRHSHRALALAGKMLVWGGYGASGFANDGAVYDPAGDAWTKVTTKDAPEGRTHFGLFAAGDTAIVWGGRRDATALGSGAFYDAVKDTWSAMPLGGPIPRFSYGGVWTGGELLVWGGTDTFDWFD